MAKQSYKKLKLTKGVKASIAQLFTENNITLPAGDVLFELQNAATQGLIYVSFGDQAALSDYDGSPLPSYWAREETEELANVFVQTGNKEAFINITVMG